MGDLIRAFDWSKTPLGPAATWPPSLKTAARIMLGARHPMFVWWGENLINFYNDACKTAVGGKHPGALGQPASAVWREIWDRVGSRAEAALSGDQSGEEGGFSLSMARAASDETGFTFNCIALPGEGNRLGGIVGVEAVPFEAPYELRERQMRAEAEDVRQRTVNVVDNLPIGVTALDATGRITYVNAARNRIFGQAGLPPVGAPLLQRWPAFLPDGSPLAADDNPAIRALRGELVQNIELQYQRPDGTRRWIRASGIPVRNSAGEVIQALAIAVDIEDEKRAQAEFARLTETLEQRIAQEVAERLKAEETLRQMQKMQVIGQLTGGVAHDFNNLLQIILGNLDSLNRRVDAIDDGDKGVIRQPLDAAIRGAERAAVLTQQLLAYSRRQSLEPKSVDVNELVLRISELLRRTLGESVEIETVIAGGLPSAFADPNQLESALLNLAVNARDAMRGGGKLTIETAEAFLDEAYAVRYEEVTAGRYVMIAVSDEGTGMPADIMTQAFEPFFTTKGIGKGTGLGLSQVYGFVKQSGGHVKLYSEVGAGTVVKLYLPQAPNSASEAADSETTPLGVGRSFLEHILLVEDDPDVRIYSSEILRELGYRVSAANDGPEALHIMGGEDRIHLLFTDVGLPGGMNGRQLADEARKRFPGLKVLFTTGYARNAIVHHGRLDPGVDLIPKPFTYAALAAKIRHVLDAKD